MIEDVRRALEKAGVLFEQRLGAGAFAEVWRVRFRNLPRAMRICLNPADDSFEGKLVNQERNTLREIVAISELCNRSGFIEELPLALAGDPPQEYFVTVWQLATSNLAEWWRSNLSDDRDVQLLRYFAQVAKMIDLLNRYGFHHRDVKAENILLEGDAARLCDLGLAKYTGLTTYQGTRVGTPGHMPPEMEAHGESHITNDLYSLAASYLRLKTHLEPRRFLELAAEGPTPPGLQAAEAPLVAAALHPEPRNRPQNGAAAWVCSLQDALTRTERWEENQNEIRTQTAPRPARAATTPVASSPPVDSMSTLDRAIQLLERLERLYPPSLLDQVAFRLQMPHSLRPAAVLPHGDRCRSVVEWAQAQDLLLELQSVLDGFKLRR